VRRGLPAAVALTLLLGLFVWLTASLGFGLLRSGEPAGVGLGVAALILPVIAVWFMFREWQLAAAVQQMANQLAAEGRLPIDNLPRSPGGRIDRAAALTVFEEARQAAESSPEDWEAMYNLAFAYEAGGDRRRARAALRTAARLHTTART
jgi:hypothetical protein